MKVVFLVVGLFFSVRGFAEHCLSNGQFTDTPNGCKHKGLVWSKPSDALMSFAKADTYCANMPKIDGVKKAWRLPTSEEFKAITKDGAVDVLKGVDLGRLYWMGGKKRGTPALYFFPQDVLLADQSVEGEYGVICVEEIRHIKQISVGFQHACVLDHEGVKCWGSNYYGQTEVPILNNPTQLLCDGYRTCALDQLGVKCWGLEQSDDEIPLFGQSLKFSKGWCHTCELSNDRINCSKDICYGELTAFGQLDVPYLKQPTQVACGGHHTCALDLEGVKCWGATNHFPATVPPEFIYPQ